jgi:oligopeptide/dipeptide ABC transporter ATP-binding protein
MKPLLEIDDLHVELATPAGPVRALDGVSFRIAGGESVALVGESGSGKTTLALAILRLAGHAAAASIRGRVVFEGRDLGRLTDEEMRTVRGARIAMIFQEPMSALDPLFTIGEQVAETLLAHAPMSRRSARDRAFQVLGRVGLPNPERAFSLHPHEMSGGMRQRAMIAIAIACGPSLLVADEPTSALDVTVRAEILDLLKRLRAEQGMSLLLVTHDLAVAAENAERVLVMYAGSIVEEGRTLDVLRSPAHPYTALLLRARLGLGSSTGRLAPIAGVARAIDGSGGCRFRSRCPIAREKCADVEPVFARAGRSTEMGAVADADDLRDSRDVRDADDRREAQDVRETDDASHRAACHFSEETSRL